MKEFYNRIFSDHKLGLEMVLSTLFANILALATSLYVIQVLNRYVAFGVTSTLLTLTLGVVLAVVFEFGFRSYRVWVGNKISSAFDSKLASDTFATMTACNLMTIEGLPVGFRQQVLQDVEAIRRAYTSTNMGTVLDLPFICLFFAIIFFISFPLFLIGIGGSAILLFLGYIGLKKSNQLQPMIQETTVLRGSLANTVVNEPSLIRAFNASGFLCKKWLKTMGTFLGLQQVLETSQQTIQSLTQSMTMVVTVVVICLGAVLVVKGHLTVGTLIGVNILTSRAVGSVSKFNSLMGLLSTAQEAQMRLDELEKIPLELQEGSQPKDYSGKLELSDVSITFESQASPLIESLSVAFEPGMIIAITGPNGAGKTTLAKLLVGLLEPVRGQVLVDGVDLRQIVSTWWRRQVCFLPQDANFFDGTILENILVAKETVQKEELQKIIHMADLTDYLDKSANGLQEPITNRGENLSMSVRKRIALVRALVTGGPLVILDEPIEGLDPRGRAAIYKLIDDLHAQNKTIVMTTFDEPLLAKATCIIDLESKPIPTVRYTKNIPKE